MKYLVFVLVLGGLTGAASAQWSDNFDSYATGSQMHGQGGWKGWQNDPGSGALTSSFQALSAPNSVAIGGGSDLVHEYSGVTSGAWTYYANVFMPTGRTGTTYFILMNRYSDAGGFQNGWWSVELGLAANGGVLDNLRSETPRTMNVGAWNEIRVDFDLTANTQSTFINGDLLSAGTWTTDGNSQLNLAVVDLYAGNTSNVFYDNLRLVPEPTTMAALSLGVLAFIRRRRK